MRLDDRFDDLVTSLGGFYRAWVIQLGLELGLFTALRAAEPRGLAPAELAAATETAADPIAAWCRAAYACDLVDDDGERLHLDDVTASILLDVDRPEYLGGQFAYTVTASLDYADMAQLLRTGRTVAVRPPRYYRSIEQLTQQDIAVFFEEALAAMPNLVTLLAGGADVVDLHCGGGRWLVAVARRFPAARLVGVESEPDSTARAMRLVQEAGLGIPDPHRGAGGGRDHASRSLRPRLLPAGPARARGPGGRARSRVARAPPRAAGSWSSAGACRPASTTWRRFMASSSPGWRSTRRSTAVGCARWTSMSSCSRLPVCRHRRRSPCRRTLCCSWSSDRPDPGCRDPRPRLAAGGLPSSHDGDRCRTHLPRRGARRR